MNLEIIFSIVRGNKGQVNEYFFRGPNFKQPVNDASFFFETVYNGFWKGVHMANVAVLTDLCASIPEQILERLHIRTVACYIHRGQEILRDLVTIRRDEFLRRLITARWPPHHGQPRTRRFIPDPAQQVCAITRWNHKNWTRIHVSFK